MTQRIEWEYLVVFIPDSKVAEGNPEFDNALDADTYTDKLNRYGEAGWELVGFDWTEHGAKCALKRPKKR